MWRSNLLHASVLAGACCFLTACHVQNFVLHLASAITSPAFISPCPMGLYPLVSSPVGPARGNFNGILTSSCPFWSTTCADTDRHAWGAGPGAGSSCIQQLPAADSSAAGVPTAHLLRPIPQQAALQSCRPRSDASAAAAASAGATAGRPSLPCDPHDPSSRLSPGTMFHSSLQQRPEIRDLFGS